MDSTPPKDKDVSDDSERQQTNPVHSLKQGQQQKRPSPIASHQGESDSQQTSPLYNSVEPIQISVKRLTGKQYSLKVYPHETVHKLKQQLQEKAQLPADIQCLSFNGKPMEDEQRLSAYNIEHESILTLGISTQPREEDLPETDRCSVQ